MINNKKTYALFLIIVSGLLLGGCSLLQPQPSNGTNENNTDNQNEQIDGTPPTEQPQTNLKKNLSNQNLEEIPEYIFSQNDLQELDVSGNQLTGAIQAEIRHLQNLKVLNASDNQMTGVPAEIGQLRNLQVLNLSDNQLTGLPYELGDLQNLKILDISGNNYSESDLNIIQEKLRGNVNIIK